MVEGKRLNEVKRTEDDEMGVKEKGRMKGKKCEAKVKKEDKVE